MPESLDDPPGGGLTLARVLDNLAREIQIAEEICVSVELIIADRLRSGVADSDEVRVELQNIDRLVQMLADFRTLLTHLGKASDETEVDAEACGAHLVMDELRRRLLSRETAHDVPTPSVQPSDITFF